MLRYPERCFTQYESNIGYYPRRTVRATEMRYGPSDDAPVKLTVPPNHRVGLQSVRNPQFLTHPAPRGARDGYVWVFMLRGGESGWVRLADLREDDPHPEPWADGPASMDFEVGLGEPRPKRRPRYTIGWRPRGALERRVTAENLYLRYSVRGTAFHFLLTGDRVQVRWHHPRGFSCVQVLEAAWCPVGTIGWVWRNGLERAA